MKRNHYLAIALLAVGAIATAGVGNVDTFKRIVKKGDTASYKLKVEIDLEGQVIDYSADVNEKVISVEKDGSYAIEAKSENILVMMGGSELPGAEEEQLSTTTYAPSGLIMKIESDQMDPDSYRFSSLMNFMWPTKSVAVGSKWTIKTEANAEKGTYDTEHKYEILSKQKLLGHDCYKIKFNTHEISGDEASSEGHIWIDVKTGLTVKIEGEMIGAPMGGMVMDAAFSLTLVN